MSIEGANAPVVSLNNNSRPANPQSETYFGSKLVQALAEYSGRFRSEFKLNESDPK